MIDHHGRRRRCSPLQFTYPELAEPSIRSRQHAVHRARRAIRIETHADVDALVLGTHFAPPAAPAISTRSTAPSGLGQATPPAG
ncbi:MAG: hypothetical protein R2710_05545 [Acidimicrobiales bacterium]